VLNVPCTIASLNMRIMKKRQFVLHLWSYLSLRSPAFNSHLCYAANLFLSLCNTFPIKTICPKRPSVLYGH
jgi:hypothetical protein